MRLQSLSYAQFRDDPREWRLDDLALGPINLLVGRNASGKTKSLNIIANLARLLAGEVKPQFLSGQYSAHFSEAGRKFEYALAYDETGVVDEHLSIDGEARLARGKGRPGQIFAEQEGKSIQFQPPDSELAAVARRDSVQHSFLEPLHAWGSRVHHYYFGTSLGKDVLGFLNPELKTDLNPRDQNSVIAIFRRGEKTYGAEFAQSVRDDMKSVGYDLESVSVGPPVSMRVSTNLPGQPVFLIAKERDLLAPTDQNEMSQGMFRSLSIIVQVNYALMALQPSCLLIDDIGEGLDFERSVAIIDVLINKAKNSQLQLIMSTNDRFVMNRVPLETWTVLQRAPGRTRIFNYANSKELFEEFKVTGLSNYDFFATDYVTRSDGAPGR